MLAVCWVAPYGTEDGRHRQAIPPTSQIDFVSFRGGQAPKMTWRQMYNREHVFTMLASLPAWDTYTVFVEDILILLVESFNQFEPMFKAIHASLPFRKHLVHASRFMRSAATACY